MEINFTEALATANINQIILAIIAPTAALAGVALQQHLQSRVNYKDFLQSQTTKFMDDSNKTAQDFAAILLNNDVDPIELWKNAANFLYILRTLRDAVRGLEADNGSYEDIKKISKEVSKLLKEIESLCLNEIDIIERERKYKLIKAEYAKKLMPELRSFCSSSDPFLPEIMKSLIESEKRRWWMFWK